MKNERLAIQFDLIGALVQLVRMPACHAGGHEFESRTHRRNLRESLPEGFSGAYETRTRDLLRDRQAF